MKTEHQEMAFFDYFWNNWSFTYYWRRYYCSDEKILRTCNLAAAPIECAHWAGGHFWIQIYFCTFALHRFKWLILKFIGQQYLFLDILIFMSSLFILYYVFITCGIWWIIKTWNFTKILRTKLRYIFLYHRYMI